MKIRLILISLLLFPSLSGALELKPGGVGDIYLSQHVKKIQKILGENFYKDRTLDEDEVKCHYVEPETIRPPVNLMIEKEILTRIDVFSEKIASPKGLRIGDSEKLIYEKFGTKIEKREHPYLGKEGAYLIIDMGKSKLLFETFAGKIQAFRIGMEPAIYYIEGCPIENRKN